MERRKDGKEGRKEGRKEGTCTYKSVFVTEKERRYIIASVLKGQFKLESQAREEKLSFCECYMTLIQCSVSFSSSKAGLKSE